MEPSSNWLATCTGSESQIRPIDPNWPWLTLIDPEPGDAAPQKTKKLCVGPGNRNWWQSWENYPKSFNTKFKALNLFCFRATFLYNKEQTQLGSISNTFTADFEKFTDGVKVKSVQLYLTHHDLAILQPVFKVFFLVFQGIFTAICLLCTNQSI